MLLNKSDAFKWVIINSSNHKEYTDIAKTTPSCQNCVSNFILTEFYFYFELHRIILYKAKKKILCLKACGKFQIWRGMRFFSSSFFSSIFLVSIFGVKTDIRLSLWLFDLPLSSIFRNTDFPISYIFIHVVNSLLFFK